MIAQDDESLSALEGFLAQQSTDQSQLTLRVRKRFNWGRAMPMLGASGSTAVRPNAFGTVEGLIFDDLDLDGTLSTNEHGVRFVTMILDGERRTQVDSTGRFAFTNVPVGRHRIEIELTSVPALYSVGSRVSAVVEVARRESAVVSFPLVRLGKVAGRVDVIDRTTAPPTDGGAPRVRPGTNLIIQLNGRSKVTMTDADGEFEFTGLPTGEYRLEIDPHSLPRFWTVSSEKQLLISLEPGEKVAGLRFVVDANPPELRRVLSTSQPAPEPSAPAPTSTSER